MEQEWEMGVESLADSGRNHLYKGPVLEGRLSMKTWEKVNVGDSEGAAGGWGAKREKTGKHKLGYHKDLALILIPMGIFQET